MESANELLTLLIAHESQVVTYRRLSRELKVHVNAAKQHLADYHRAHQGSCSATFLVSGTRRTGDVCVRLVAEPELRAALEEIDGARHHVYSVGPAAGASRQAVVMANIVAGSIRANAEHGAVRSSVELAPDAADHVPAAQPALSAAPQPDVKPALRRKESSPVGTPAPSSKEKPASKPAKSFFGRAASGEKPPGKPRKTEPADVPPTPPARSPSPEPPKVKVEAAPVHEPDDAANAARNRAIEDMFADDSDFDTTPAIAAVKIEDSEDGADSPAEDTGRDTQGGSDVEMGGAASGTGPRARKRRKVTKVRHTKNARGMLVSEAVEVWESCSESEAEAAAPQHATPARPSAGDGRKDSQAPASRSRKTAEKAKAAAPKRSILSFFGKK
ncbi:CDC27 protein [Coemansia nantahalensis]|uniref:CDC27 protein n=1 Tax=Coemansia nantahalensis TaxID=2789366 RepID=A0ACC1K2N4_9FUNG|nr:CDC27 protein [Coemansia nantahalensis]